MKCFTGDGRVIFHKFRLQIELRSTCSRGIYSALGGGLSEGAVYNPSSPYIAHGYLRPVSQLTARRLDIKGLLDGRCRKNWNVYL